MTEAAYLIASGREEDSGLVHFIQTIGKAMQEYFGAFLCYEIWAAETNDDRRREIGPRLRPAFEIVTAETTTLPGTIDVLSRQLRKIRVGGTRATVNVRTQDHVSPPGLPPLLLGQVNGGCISLGITVKPIYRDTHTGTLFPLVLETLRQQFGPALRHATLAFTEVAEDDSRLRFPSLGPSWIPQAAADVDRDLRSVSEAFDLILQATPVNAKDAWPEFRKHRYRKTPALYCRLRKQCGFARKRAFTIALRAYRAGGLTKDLMYLRGLRELLLYLSKGHEIEPLFVGKIALRHVPFLQDLRRRGIIRPPAVLPRYLAANRVRERLQTCRTLTIEQLVAEQLARA